MRLTRNLIGFVLWLAGCVVGVAGFYFSLVAGIAGVACGLALWGLAELTWPPPAGPKVFDTAHLPPEVPAPYDVRTRVTPARLWSDF